MSGAGRRPVERSFNLERLAALVLLLPAFGVLMPRPASVIVTHGVGPGAVIL